CSSCFGTYQPVTRPEDVPRKTLARAATAPAPSTVDSTVGAGMTVLIVDTGLADSEYRPAFSGAVPDLHKPDVEIPNTDDDGSVDSTAGHGTFIAAIIERMAPGATIEIKRMLSTFGVGDDATIGEYLDSIAVDDLPNIVNLSFGAYTEDDQPPVVISEAIRGLIDKGDQRRKSCPDFQGPYIVASAGNSASCRKSWPAALPEVISVGAICATGPAWFSNFGPWVKACAPGVDIVSKFFYRESPADPPPPIPADADGAQFHGWARWSGTSFSAPIVIGALLQRRHLGGTLDDAVQALIYDPGLTRMPGLGAIVNVHP
ncbi:MAG: S8/S53 family peptidase, partial [Acidimicrobiia bacterium]|nr:S8/S53 family peptidase [Acidimicrobiia bacterium]